MQDQNSKSGFSRIPDSIANLIDTICAKFEISKRQAEVDRQTFQNMEANLLIRKAQEEIKAANQDIPVLLSSKSKLQVLEALLVARARDGQPIEDLVKAIECLRANIIEFEEKPSPNSIAKSTKSQKKDREEVIVHKYDIPILSEIGDIIGIGRTLILLSLLVGGGSLLLLSTKTAQICAPREISPSDVYENRSLFCQVQDSLNGLLEDYHPKD